MKDQVKDPWLLAFVAFQLFGSIAALVYCGIRWKQFGTLLPYEPRRPVPWGAAGAILAVLFMAQALAQGFASDGAEVDFANKTPEAILQGLLASIVVQALGPTLLLIIAATKNASRSDIGLPAASPPAWARDISIGVVACLAAFIPVLLVNAAAHYALDAPEELTKHPLVEMLTQTKPGIVVMVLAAFMAVVVAPVCEEITFRLLLQGWLEKWEDKRLGWRQPAVETTPVSPAGEIADLATPLELDERVALVPVDEHPPKRGLAGLPYGWTPILISSAVFALAHFGYGPEPIPLFALAIVLGYCYQRTHRIIPSIVAHALFNASSMVTLWRLMVIGEG